MGVEKGSTKSGGFFNLFDWNRKSRKKLFVSPEGAKQGKRINDNLPTTQFRLVDEDEGTGVSSVKGSSEYSCASSVTDEEGNGVRAPGVVARLMGLDAMPSVSEPSRTPLFDTRSLQDNRSSKRSPEFCINDQFSNVRSRGEGYARKMMELRPQKMPSSPIERFQTEMLPPRSAKSISMTHHKLLSPIKNPNFISARNAAHIMEAAAKILEPGLQSSTKSRLSSFESGSIPLRVRDSRDSQAGEQRMPRIIESARRPFEAADSRYLRGQPLNRSWNGSESGSVYRNGSESGSMYRRPLESEGNSLPSAKGKGKSVSLAIQAKVNVQRREGLSASSRSNSDQNGHDECKLQQPFKSQPSNQRNKLQKQPLNGPKASGVLRHNNQKQNCQPSKGKSAIKHSNSNQQDRKSVSGDGYCGKNKAVNRNSGNFRAGFRKEGVEAADRDREGSTSSNKDFPQKKRLIERSFQSDHNGIADNILVGRHEKHVHPNVIIDEQARWKEDGKRDGMDVVSFTFTSPLNKPMHGPRSSIQAVEKPDKVVAYSFDTSTEKKASTSKDKRLSSLGSNGISGDALSLLLEQKLRELTAGVELSDCSFANSASSAASSALTQESGTAYNALSMAGGKEVPFLRKHSNTDKPDATLGFGVSSTNGQVFGANNRIQVVEEVECSSSSDARKEPEEQNPSPLSVLEASFSNESCNSSESSITTNESKLCTAYAQSSDVSSNCSNKLPSTEPEIELLDSASSSSAENRDRTYASEVGTSCMNPSMDDLEYMRAVLQNTGLIQKNLGDSYLSSDTAPLDSLMFDKLENKRSLPFYRGDGDGKLRRKLVFDCMNECLDLRYNHYFRAGYESWAKGVTVARKDLAEELHQEILGWKSMGEWMVDDLVDKDMSSHMGKWSDFGIEAFETGVDIEREILKYLVDEVVSDFLVSRTVSVI